MLPDPLTIVCSLNHTNSINKIVLEYKLDINTRQIFTREFKKHTYEAIASIFDRASGKR